MAESRSWERQSRYNERMTRQYPIRLNTKTDADVIEHLDGLSESRAGYIKRLIREDMMKVAEAMNRFEWVSDGRWSSYQSEAGDWIEYAGEHHGGTYTLHLADGRTADIYSCDGFETAGVRATGILLRLEQEAEEAEADRWHVQEYEVEADLFLKTDWTEEDEEKRAYMVRGWLEAFAQRDPKTGEWYVPQPDGWADGIAERKGEVIEALLSAPDAPEGIREWYEEH